MKDPRMIKLAEVLIDHSTKLKKGEKIYIEAFDIPEEMVEILVDKVYEKEGVPIVSQKSAKVLRKIFRGCDELTMETIGALEMEKIKKADAYIGLRGSHNITEHSDVPSEKMELYKKHWFGPVHINYRVPKTKWVVLRWPTSSMALQAKMSTESCEAFYFNSCTMD
jgi:aminopeptidase